MVVEVFEALKKGVRISQRVSNVPSEENLK